MSTNRFWENTFPNAKDCYVKDNVLNKRISLVLLSHNALAEVITA